MHKPNNAVSKAFRTMYGWAITESPGLKTFPYLIAYKMAGRQGDEPGESMLFMRQEPHVWHCFLRTGGNGSSMTPWGAWNAALGLEEHYVLEFNPKQSRAFRELMFNAPVELRSRFLGLDNAVRYALK